MDWGIIQRPFASMDSQKAGTLRKGSISQAADFQEFAAALEAAVFIAIGYDVFGDGGIDTGNMAQQGRGCCVQIYADMIDGGFNGSIERASEFFLVDIMLILSDTNGLGIDLYQFGERILYPAGNRYGPTDGHIIVRQFFTGQF